MKMMAGVLAVAGVLLSACGTPPPESTAGAVDPAVLRTNEQALRGNCTISVECGDGSVLSCSGTATGCSVGFDSWYGVEYVVCNGNQQACPFSTGTCHSGKRCRTNGDCGMDGVCTTQGTCACY